MGAACVTTIHTALWLRVGGQNVAASGLQLSLCEANTLLPPGMCEESQIKACSCLLSPDNVRQRCGFIKIALDAMFISLSILRDAWLAIGSCYIQIAAYCGTVYLLLTHACYQEFISKSMQLSIAPNTVFVIFCTSQVD